jgi:hypothetical protein
MAVPASPPESGTLAAGLEELFEQVMENSLLGRFPDGDGVWTNDINGAVGPALAEN